MKKAPLPPNESKRLAALKKYQVLDTPAEHDLDELTKMAASICGTPIALISLVDECRQWFKSKSGLDANETHRDVAFCAHAILGDSALIVPDAKLDERFADNPLVVGAPFVRFYAGFPLASYSGENIGTLCVIDHEPRSLETWQIDAIKSISRLIVHFFELRLHQKNSELRDGGFLAAIAHNMLEGAVLQDKDGKIVMANPAAFDVLDLTEAQLLGRDSMDPRWSCIREDGSVFPGSEHPAMVALATDKPQLSKRMGITRPRGDTRWLQVNSNLIYPTGSGGPKFVLSTFTDITNEIESSKNLQLLSDKHRLILDSIPALVAYWDHEQMCRFANHAYLTWFAKRPEEILGKSMLELLGPRLYELNRGYIETALSGERVTFDRELKLLATGEMRQTTAHYIPDRQNGEVKGFYVLVLDFTEVKRLEEAAQAEAARALAASRSKSDFLANMSHEIRTPINGVMGMASLLADTKLDSPQTEYVKNIRSSSEMLLALVNDILDLSKAEAGKTELENVNFELGQIVSDVDHSLAFAANKKGLKFVHAIATEVPHFIVGDPTRLTQVLFNLVSNAIKFTEKGQVSLDASLKSIDNENIVLKFEISDTGIGVSEESLSRLFTPFTQADGSTTRKYGGTGLGLSIAKHLVTLMGGEIGVRSEYGKGSVFWFTIKANIGKRVVDVSKPVIESARVGKKLRVLVAEDNSVNQMIAVKMIEKIGHSVIAVANGIEAIDALKVGNFDVVFMDCQMPEMDGYEATQTIRRDSKSAFSKIPIVAMTANAMIGDREKCFAAGMDDYISKPMKIDDIDLALRRIFLPLNKTA